MKRPKTRGDCINGPRPCPWVGCRHHLANAARASDEFILRDGWEDQETCSLDVADRGAVPLCEVQRLMGLSCGGITNGYRRALEKFRKCLLNRGLDPETLGCADWQDALKRRDWLDESSEKRKRQ